MEALLRAHPVYPELDVTLISEFLARGGAARSRLRQICAAENAQLATE